jgi:hypothetical protein
MACVYLSLDKCDCVQNVSTVCPRGRVLPYLGGRDRTPGGTRPGGKLGGSTPQSGTPPLPQSHQGKPRALGMQVRSRRSMDRRVAHSDSSADQPEVRSSEQRPKKLVTAADLRSAEGSSVSAMSSSPRGFSEADGSCGLAVYLKSPDAEVSVALVRKTLAELKTHDPDCRCSCGYAQNAREGRPGGCHALSARRPGPGPGDCRGAQQNRAGRDVTIARQAFIERTNRR